MIKNYFIKNTKGYSLLELNVALGIFIIMIILVGSFMFQAYVLNRFTAEQNEAIESAKKSVETIVSELREASTADTGAYVLDTADAQNLIFYSDIDSDAAVEKIRYYLAGTDLTKETTKPGGDPLQYNAASTTSFVLSEYVRNGTTPIFTYYTGNYPASSTPLSYSASVSQAKLVHVYLEINVNVALAPDSIKVESDVQIRNLKTNL